MSFHRSLRSAVVASLAGVTLFLAGCVTFAADLVVNESDQVSGSIVVAYAQEIAAVINEDPELSGWQKRYESLPGVSIRGVDRSGQVGNEVVLTNIPIESFSTAGSGPPPIRIIRQGDNLEILGELDFTGYGDESESEDQVFTTRLALFSPADLRVSITVPGEIRSTNGTVDDETNTITWRLRLGQDNRIEATVFSPLARGVGPLLLWVAVGAGAIGIAAGAAIALTARRRRPPSTV